MKTWKHCLLTFLLIAVWAIVFVALLNVCFELITCPDTICNIAGVLGVVLTFAISAVAVYLLIIEKEKN